MGAVDKFLHKLENFDKENIPTKVIKALQPYLKVRFQYENRVFDSGTFFFQPIANRIRNLTRKRYLPNLVLQADCVHGLSIYIIFIMYF